MKCPGFAWILCKCVVFLAIFLVDFIDLTGRNLYNMVMFTNDSKGRMG